jgi:GT2 family glycosyltransferase
MIEERCVALLYLAWNRLEFTRETFSALLANTAWRYVHELFVYDDGSQDGTCEWLERTVGKVPAPTRFVKTDFGSPVTAMLHFIDSASAPILAKTDNDAMLPPGWLWLSLKVLARHPELSLLGIEAMNPHSDDPFPARSYTPAEFISGLGLYRRAAFARSRPVAFDKYYGLEEWQMAQGPSLVRGWITPALSVFLLDRLPFEPWSSYSATYIQRGWQRPGGRYDPAATLWRWRWPDLAPPFRPMPTRGERQLNLVETPEVEVTDLRKPWPWPESSAEHVSVGDTVTRLPDKIFTMNELWRILQPRGTAEIVVMTTDGAGAFQDPMAMSFWNRRSFLYYEAGNPYHERFARPYGIQARFRTLQERLEPTPDGPRLTMVLQAVKPSPFKVVILSASASNLVRCVRSVLANEPQLPPDHIIVVDDGARSEAESQLPSVHWVPGVKPFVYARNANIGICEAGTDVILLEDDAQLLTPSGFTLLSQQFETHPHLGICSAGIRGAIGNPRQIASQPSQFRPAGEMLAFVCVYIPKLVYDQVGPLDERFVGYGFQDNDYCARVQAAGCGLGIWDGCVVDHSDEMSSTFRTRPDLWDLFTQNRLLFQMKWGKDA